MTITTVDGGRGRRGGHIKDVDDRKSNNDDHDVKATKTILATTAATTVVAMNTK